MSAEKLEQKLSPCRSTSANTSTSKQSDALYRVPLSGGVPEQLSPPVPAHDSQATSIYLADDRYVYFAAGPNGGDATLVRVAKKCSKQRTTSHRLASVS
jgi:hypothetical protein